MATLSINDDDERSAVNALAADDLRIYREDALRQFENIDWAAYTRTGSFLNQDEVKILQAVENQPLEVIFTDEKGAEEYIELLLKVLQNVTSNQKATNYILTKMEDILANDASKRSKFFLTGSGVDCAPFMRLIRGNDEPQQQRVASTVLATLLSEQEGECGMLLDWIVEALAGGRGRSQTMRLAVQALAILLRATKARLLFGQAGGVGYLTKLLRLQGGEANAQLLYEIAFSMWTLALVDSLQQDFLTNSSIPALVEQITAAPREKVVRMALATLRLLSEGDESRQYVEEMMHCGLTKTLRNLRQRQWADPDIGDDVEVLYNKLMQDYHELSTFEMYAQEVKSGNLKWGVCHTEKFWKENVREMETDDFKLVRQLVTLLHSSDDEVVAIACYDIGEFVRFYPNGKSIIKHINAKNIIMDLIEHENPTVQRHALQCISKIMVNKWEFVR